MKHSALAAAAAAAVMALSACSSGTGAATPQVTPLPTSSALPTATATPSVKPSPAATGITTRPTPPPRRTTTPPTTQATPLAPTDIPGDLGTVPEGFTLPEENRPGDGETSAFTTTVWRASCPDRVLTLASASGLTATRIKESIGPESAVAHGLLVFTDEAAAEAFMTELRTQLGACVAEGPAEDDWRTAQATRPVTGLGEEALSVSSWSQWNAGTEWVDGPGAGVEYIARQGPHVVLTEEGGEYVGDPTVLPEVVLGLETRITAMLEQL